MTAPTPPGGRSPLWIAGVALVGVGVLSGVVGLIGLGTEGGSGPEASASPPPSSAPAEPGTGVPPGDGSASAAPGTPGAPGAPGAPGGAGTSPLTPGAPGTPGAVGGPAAPGAGTPGGQPVADGGTSAGRAGGGSGGSGVAARPAVRVYNNSTIKGLAEKAAEEFRANGWNVVAVTNYSQGVIPATTVYYRQGTNEKAAADEMARRWGMRSEPRFQGIQDATPGIIVIITKDFKAA